jgi:ABC-2 type transport system permease protein
MPHALQLITLIVPARYFLIALRGIVLKGTPIALLWPQMIALSIYALVMMSLASLRLAREKR